MLLNRECLGQLISKLFQKHITKVQNRYVGCSTRFCNPAAVAVIFTTNITLKLDIDSSRPTGLESWLLDQWDTLLNILVPTNKWETLLNILVPTNNNIT